MPELGGMMATVARSCEGEKDDFLSKLPGIPVRRDQCALLAIKDLSSPESP
jgi:hypothetical protein